jgi:hypothetical protein
MKSDFILNVDISVSNKFGSEKIESIIEKIESEFSFNEFSLILIENLDVDVSGNLEIYIEDLEMEFDLTEDIDSILEELDIIIPGITKGSRIEWNSSRDLCNHIWTKETRIWKKSEEEGNTDFYEDSFFEFDD